MEILPFHNGTYKTDPSAASSFARLTPSFSFYRRMAAIVLISSSRAKRGHYGDSGWAESSQDIMKALEHVGVTIEVTGVDHFIDLHVPCVFIGNHMSTLETFVLPGIIEPLKDVTFVVKKSLIDYPVFRYVMRSRDPVVVGRVNPREDLKAVLDGGTERLKTGRSVIIFPQTTRTPVFDPAAFNTIGIKLAKKAGVPVIPIALKTDAWGNGKHLKDFGRIDPSKKVHFAFGEPLSVKGNGAGEHQRIIEFISGKLKEWGSGYALRS
ncbi:MAG: 1-acyl-sn-glycerol-3-phosphate acyltransferase [Nitrospirae bacterium]|nr:1-acyl-sn-glycerol-3-phosphate acyltransferase [Nitrospirota bacterium]